MGQECEMLGSDLNSAIVYLCMLSYVYLGILHKFEKPWTCFICLYIYIPSFGISSLNCSGCQRSWLMHLYLHLGRKLI